MWRWQPPVHSPLDGRSIARGLRALLTGRSRAERRARELLRERYGARRVVLTDSGTSALTLALRAATPGDGEPVAVPAYSCYDVATAWIGAGVRPRLYDVDPESLGPDADSLAAAVRDGAAAVLLAYLYGTPIDWSVVREASGDAGALVVEDAAQGLGCRWQGRRAGSLGDLSVLSFGRGKGWTAGGGGALMALTGRGEESLARIGTTDLRPTASVPAMARSLAQWVLGRPSLYGIPARIPLLGLGETVYRPPTPPGAPSTFSLGVLPATIELQEHELEARRDNAARLQAAVVEAGDLVPVPGPDGIPAGHLRLPVLVEGKGRRRLASRRAVRLGVAPGYPKPLHALPQVRNGLDAASGADLRGSERLAANLYTLPTHGLLRPRDLDALTRLLRDPADGADRRGPTAA